MSQRSARPGIGRAVSGSSRVSPSNKPMATRISGWPVIRAGSSDSGSAPLMMVMSAGGSRRPQPKIRAQNGNQKEKRAREINSGARLKRNIALLGRVGAGALLVGDRSSNAGELVAGCAVVAAAAAGGRAANCWRLRLLLMLHLLFKFRRAGAGSTCPPSGQESKTAQRKCPSPIS